MKFLLLIMLFLTNLMNNASNPFMMGLILLTQIIVVCLISRILSHSSWISLTLFLVIVGGLMILFLYTTSIYSNQRFNIINMKPTIFYTMLISPLLILQNNFLFKIEYTCLINITSKEYIKLFLPMNMVSSTTMFFYLLLVLFIMIFMLNYPSGPMRKKY
uniref:NADH dehydrogenase subunit 6 n=1 Tax=Pachypsylla venusta TaxID=38123 RepID=Q69HC7_PACVE|nr:NADH dehydrogenase subunit 6 [Pachypsylla venusta]